MTKKAKRKKSLHIGRGDMRVSSFDLPTHADPVDVHIVAPDSDQKILVTKTLRDAPLDRLHIRKQIDDCMYAAGDWARGLFELFGSDGVRAMDFAKPFIDSGSVSAIGVTDAQLRAAKHLKVMSHLLGVEGFELVCDVIGKRKFIEHVARERGMTSQRQKDYLAGRFRECLDTISVIGGFKVRGRTKAIRDAYSIIAQTATKPVLHRSLVAANDQKRLKEEAQAQTKGRDPVDRPTLTLPKDGEAA